MLKGNDTIHMTFLYKFDVLVCITIYHVRLFMRSSN